VVTQRDKYELNVSSALKNLAKLAAAWAVIKTVLIDSVKAFAAQEQAELKLQQALRVSGQLTDKRLQRLKDQASAIQEVSVFGDEMVLGLMAQATGLGVVEDKLDEVVRGALGLSKATGIDLNSALKKVSKESKGVAAAWSEVGIEFDKSRPVLEQITAKYGEFIKVTGSTVDRLKQLDNAWGDTQEQIGAMVLTAADATWEFKGLALALGRVNKAVGSPGGFIDSWKALLGELGNTDRQKITEKILSLEEKIAKTSKQRLVVGRQGETLMVDQTFKIKAMKDEVKRLEAALTSLAMKEGVIRGGKGFVPVDTELPDVPVMRKGRGKGKGGGIDLKAIEDSVVDLHQETNARLLALDIEATSVELELARRTAQESINIEEFKVEASNRLLKTRLSNSKSNALGELGNIQLVKDESLSAFDIINQAGSQAYATLANTIAQAAMSGKDMTKAIGSQLMAMGIQWLITAPVAFFSPERGGPAGAAVYAAQGAAALAAGAAMGGGSSASGGGGGGGRRAVGANQSFGAPPGSAGSREPVTNVTNLYLQGALIQQNEAFSVIKDADRRSGLGVRRGNGVRRPFE